MQFIFIMAGVAILFGIGLIFYDYNKKKKDSEEDRLKYIPTTPDQIPIDYIRSGIIKLKNGGYRVVVEVPSVNIELMEWEEQEIVLNQYRQILNGIEFPFQILQQSRTIDVGEYMDLLEKKRAETKNRLNKKLMAEFRVFLAQLIKERTILTKRFYIVVPYDEEREVKTVYATSETKNKKKKQAKKKRKEDPKVVQERNILEEEKRFEKARKQLFMRANSVERVFRQFDIVPTMLEDSEVAELFYAAYNKERSVYQPLNQKPSDYTALYVKSERRSE